MQVRAIALGAGVLCLASVAYAGIVVKTPNFSIPQNSTQAITFSVTGGQNSALEDIEGMVFTVQIGDGLGATPSMTSVDMLTGTIWSGHVSPANVIVPIGGDDPQFQSRSLFTDLPGDFVDANGILATVVFDTTGAAEGDYTVILTGTMDPGSDSQFYSGVGDPVAATFLTATLTVTPIPAPAATPLLMLAWVRSPRRRERF